MGEGNGNGKAPVIGLRNECVPEKLLVAQRRKGSLLVYDPTFHQLFFNILDPDVFSSSRRTILPD